MNPESEAQNPERERGFLLIADMEGSTESKFRLGEQEAFELLREHNRIIIEQCRKATPIPGEVINSLGDAVVAKFPAGVDETSRRDALISCLSVAQAILTAFEALPPVRQGTPKEFWLRTKVTLQYYDAFRYRRGDEPSESPRELVGTDIDVAFRVSTVAWRLQLLATERFIAELLRHSSKTGSLGQDTEGSDLPETQQILGEARAARRVAARSSQPMMGIDVQIELSGQASYLECWVTDARKVTRLKGIPEDQTIFLISFHSPESLLRLGQRQRLTIKVRQDHHAVILARVSLEQQRNDNYIEHVIHMLENSSQGNDLESEITLFAAAKIYGDFDFFFRVSCVDDGSLRKFFQAIRHERFGVNSVEVRSTVAGRFNVTPHYDRILDYFGRREHNLVLTWFEPDSSYDLFEYFVDYMHSAEEAPVRPVEVLEVGEVIHHMPVYCLFLCHDLKEYASFFSSHDLNPTACRSHIAQIVGPDDAQLRYSLLSGIYLPTQRAE